MRWPKTPISWIVSLALLAAEWWVAWHVAHYWCDRFWSRMLLALVITVALDFAIALLRPQPKPRAPWEL